MSKIVETTIDKLHPDDKNFNKGTEYGEHLMEQSLRKFGLGRSILLDRNNQIIAGNKTTEKAGELGFEKVVIVETDGNTLVAVKRNDIDLDSAEGRELALADNATSEANLEWDYNTINQAVEEFGISTTSWGVKIDDLQPLYQDVANATERSDDFEEEFNSYNDTNCEMPIVPDFFESHECFIIPVHNSIDEGFVRDLFGLNEIYRSASGDGKERKTNVVSVEKLRSLVK
jgi:hypothetical protein bfra3_11761|nr:MAG TPA: ParB protein [Caudoviricetes sp.]